MIEIEMTPQEQIATAGQKLIAGSYRFAVRAQPQNDAYVLSIKDAKGAVNVCFTNIELEKNHLNLDHFLSVKIKKALYVLDKAQ